MNAEKLAKLQAQVRMGGKGTPRRKVKKVVNKANSGDDRKLSAALTKLNVQPIPGVDEVNMFKDDGKVIHFNNPRVSAAANANTYAIHGRSTEKELAELIPGILNQLGPDSMAALKKLAETFQQAQGENAAGADDDEIPDLVESFEKAEIEEKKEEATA
ncbi:Nascent polypeptide-associated complex subunit beta [Mucor flavus]|uniref:Nascent polypeptide-associated complex subunit beta n=1 Tax=Mucor flavus TaxID=439312 RepID=A0ABP9YVZ9_9FUNG